MAIPNFPPIPSNNFKSKYTFPTPAPDPCLLPLPLSSHFTLNLDLNLATHSLHPPCFGEKTSNITPRRRFQIIVNATTRAHPSLLTLLICPLVDAQTVTYMPSRRYTNRYFLFIAILQLDSYLTPANPLTTWIPLIIIMGFTAARELADDRLRSPILPLHQFISSPLSLSLSFTPSPSLSLSLSLSLSFPSHPRPLPLVLNPKSRILPGLPRTEKPTPESTALHARVGTGGVGCTLKVSLRNGSGWGILC
jgi:hypothetical protein